MQINASLLMLAMFFVVLSKLAVSGESVSCAVCGMDVKRDSRLFFGSSNDGKPVKFCSYSCTHAFHKRMKDRPLFTVDFNTGKQIPAATAYFIIKSKSITKIVEFGMPPTVIAFADEASAKKKQQELGDGEVVRGYESVEKAFE